MIGCGNGHHDLAFVHECLPNVTELTAVEPDADQMTELRTKIAQQFPTVSTDFYQETAESWSAIDKPFEAVLLFYCLYYVPLPERSAVFKKLFDKVLVSGGLVFIMISPCNVEHPYIPDKLKTTLSSSPLDIDGIQICDMMKAVGFSDCYQMPMKFQMNVEEIDGDILSLLQFFSRGRASLEDCLKAAEKEFGNKKIIPHESWFGVFRKP